MKIALGMALPPRPIFNASVRSRSGKLHAVVRLDYSHYSKDAEAPIASVDDFPQAAAHLIGGLTDYAKRKGWLA